MLELNCAFEFDLSRAEEFFAALPAQAAVVLIEPLAANAEPYLLRTADLRRRAMRLLGPPDPASKRLNLREYARGVRYRQTGSAFEQLLTYYQHAKQIFPKRYRDLLRLRPPAVLKVSLRNPYPRCYVTRRIPTGEDGAPVAGFYYGPFASRRSAESFAEASLDLFKVRRCQIKIRRDPSFPGCIYSEMKMCLAPCFAGCSKEEYAAETSRLVQFFETHGGSLSAEIEKERERASEALDFERAAALHKRLDKVNDALRLGPDVVRRIQDLDAVILQRATLPQTVAIFPLFGGRLGEPFYFNFGALASLPRSAEEILREHLQSAAANPHEDLGEHLWLLARWYYSNPREGEIFFRAPGSAGAEREWPYRRILRACSRLLAPFDAAGKTAEPEPPAKPGNSG